MSRSQGTRRLDVLVIGFWLGLIACYVGAGVGLASWWRS